MFFPVILFIASTLAALAGRLYMALSFQAQTVAYSIASFKSDELGRGALCYSLALLASDAALVHRLDQGAREVYFCNHFSSSITLIKHETYYSIVIDVVGENKSAKSLKGRIIMQETAGKKVFTCVEIESF